MNEPKEAASELRMAAGSQPPPLAPVPVGKPSSGRHLIALLLSLGLGLFVLAAMIALADESLILFFNFSGLTLFRSLVALPEILMMVGIYVLMGLTPLVPKRVFLPVTLFLPVSALVGIPFLIYFYTRSQEIAWCVSLVEVLFGFGILYWVRRGKSFGWPLITEDQLGTRGFSWANSVGFLLVNVFLLLPATIMYFAFCASLAVGHVSDGFMALRPGGFSVEVKKYVRPADGKTIQLFPMAHIADEGFYQQVSRSFPTNSLVLMEGVTDEKNLITNHISYERFAKALGLSEQHAKFARPAAAKVVSADVDVEQFSPMTLDFLNLIMFIHAKGLNLETVMKLAQYSPPPGFQDQVFDDILEKRNQHLLSEITKRLQQSDHLVIPWGVAHMPGIAKEIQKNGFELKESKEYQVIRFGAVNERAKAQEKSQ